jgi:hypothetical protein
MKKVVFEEPDYLGGKNKIEMSIEDAVLEQKKVALTYGVHYLYDQDALEDFCSVNLATVVEE